MAATLILKPYERRRDAGPVTRTFVGIALVLLGAFYGLMCSILPMQLLVVPAVPVLLLSGMILWLLPDIGGVRDVIIAKGLVWYVGLNALWPGYIALNAPGLPSITPVRIVILGVITIFVLNFATSSDMRRQIVDATRAVPITRRFFWFFWGVTTLSLVFSSEVFFSVNKYANNQIFWTMMFAVSAWLALREGFAMRICRTLAWTILIVSVFAIFEFRAGAPIWISRIPSFLKIDAALLEQLGSSNARAGTEIGRVRGTFTGALYFAEYLAIVFPFVVHFLFRSKAIWAFGLQIAGVVLVGVVMYLTGSRSAMLALVLTPITYGFLVAWRLRKQRPESLAASAALFAYPVVALGMAATVLLWRRLHVLIIGGGQHQGSTDARATQWEMGLPKIASHPFGHGVGESGDVLGFYNPGSDNPTVDSYYLTLLLDYGPLGLLAFLALFATIIWLGFQAYNKTRTEEGQLLGPIIAALFNYIVIKSVASTEVNLPLIFILIGCAFGLIGRQHEGSAWTPVKAREPNWGSPVVAGP